VERGGGGMVDSQIASEATTVAGMAAAAMMAA